MAKVSSRCLHYFAAAMLVHIWCAPTWRFHTKLCKFLRNISTNICGLGKRTDLKLGEVSSLRISNKITISWLYPLSGFRFIFLLRDSENDLLIHIVWKSLPRFTRFPSLVLIRLVFTEIQPFENVKIYKEMYGNPDAVRHGVRMPYISL